MGIAVVSEPTMSGSSRASRNCLTTAATRGVLEAAMPKRESTPANSPSSPGADGGGNESRLSIPGAMVGAEVCQSRNSGTASRSWAPAA